MQFWFYEFVMFTSAPWLIKKIATSLRLLEAQWWSNVKPQWSFSFTDT